MAPGIAGTALAFWLGGLGHDVLLVEQAPALRTGGYVLNLWGVGYDAVERMGLLPRLLELRYPSDEIRIVDALGRTRGGSIERVADACKRARRDLGARRYRGSHP